MKSNTLYDKFTEFQKEQDHFNSSDINGRVLIVDGLCNYIRCFAAVPTMNEVGDHVGGISGFLKSIGSAIRTFKPTRCIIIFDGKGGSQRRRKIFPEYKENRKHMTRLNRTYDFKNKEEEKDAMTWQLMALAHLLKLLPVTILAPSNVEADDVIAYVAGLIEQRDGQSIIMSTDKDFLQLVNENIEVWNPITKKTYHIQSVIEEYGIHPNNFSIFRAMDGDKSDNIPGIRGIGRKTLIKNYPQLKDKELVDFNQIMHVAERQEKGKLFEKIRGNEKLIERNLELMDLRCPQMSTTTKMSVVDRVDAVDFGLNKMELTKQLVELQMMDAFGNYDQWIMNTWHPLVRFSKTE